MFKMPFFLFSLFLYLCCGCAVGPLVSHETARTVGQSHHELIGGFGQAGYVLKWNYGLTDRLDWGLQWESLSIGIRGKYAVINGKDDGLSLALALGTGASVGGSHVYGDIIASYLAGSWEPYSTIRVVHVTNDPVELSEKDTGKILFAVSKSEYVYGQVFLGTRYWFNPRWLLSLEGSSLFSLSSGFEIENNLILGAALGYRY
ncbi:MAG: hypothetical protein IPJ71_10245 [Bdellovibrionales bacterium]|nr:hypothetical protein [Bdellovibrionales bacterium]